MKKILTSVVLSVMAIAASAAVRYEDFGAVGDGCHDDRDAIVAAHVAANAKGVPVRARDGAVYSVGAGTNTASVRTDVDFGTAKFVIDDRALSLENRDSPLFRIESAQREIKLTGVGPLRRGQTSLGVTLPCRCLVRLENDRVRRYIRMGRNQNGGRPQQESVLVAADGTVDPSTPILWDYETVTSATAHPVDAERLVVTGGVFVTRANAAPSRYTYYTRGFVVLRSNVEMDGLRHEVTDEADHGAPYSAFVQIQNCADVAVRNCRFSAHKTFWTQGYGGKVPMGSYDLNCSHAVNVSFVNCRQTPDISDRRYWGIFGSNFCRNILFDGCAFSRFDAHMGVAGATVRNCEIGHMGLQAIGFGTFLVENTTIRASGFVNLREDFGCTWDGDFVIRNCTYVPTSSRWIGVFTGCNKGTHDFGYVCRLPRKITVDGLFIDDARFPADYRGPYLVGDIAGDQTAKYAIRPTEEIEMRNVRTASGRPAVPIENPSRFPTTRVREASVELDPATVSRRITEQFLSADPLAYKPQGTDVAKHYPEGYGWGCEVFYATVSLWVNALDNARQFGEKDLERRLVEHFRPVLARADGLLKPRFHVDYNVVGALPLAVARLTGDAQARKVGLALADFQWSEPQEKMPAQSGNPPYDEALRLWREGYTGETRLWIDDMYMINLLQTEAYKLSGERKCLDWAAKEMCLYLDKLQLENGLFYHAPDVPFVWGRGAGWMAGGMALVLKVLPTDHLDRAKILAGYRKMMAALLGYQRADGLWGQLADDPMTWGETSGSAMFAYGIAEGLCQGWLDRATYEPAVRKAWRALCGRMDDRANVADVCLGTNKRNDRQYYLDRPRVNGDPHGQAPMLWLAGALGRLRSP